MKFGEMDPMHVPANPSGVPTPNPHEQEGPDECVICSELPATVGIYCARCARGLDDDKYKRECGR